jgi:hypothetical protein
MIFFEALNFASLYITTNEHRNGNIILRKLSEYVKNRSPGVWRAVSLLRDWAGSYRCMNDSLFLLYMRGVPFRELAFPRDFLAMI